jgi:hypothetical protein
VAFSPTKIYSKSPVASMMWQSVEHQLLISGYEVGVKKTFESVTG